jgi:GT2 family glycosyltransferase
MESPAVSVIIVSYNVSQLLNVCVRSVLRASDKLNTEIIVVDNNSSDSSVEMLRKDFPPVNVIANTVNKGFAAACNQGIDVASGKYILLLNPDTVIGEDSLEKTFGYMEAHPGSGALGVRMINGSGRFLPESKRSYPSPMAAFMRLSGLSFLFPRSPLFNKYYLGGLDEHKVASVEILSGAFMLIRKDALEKAGLPDESYFMYGEDIDLSYRILKAGYNNCYFPEITILHYKGESTGKGNPKYLFYFYRAMLIFLRKHRKSSLPVDLILLALPVALLFVLSVARLYLIRLVKTAILTVWSRQRRIFETEYPCQYQSGEASDRKVYTELIKNTLLKEKYNEIRITGSGTCYSEMIMFIESISECGIPARIINKT